MAREEYNWLDDPFDEKKQKADQEQMMSGASRLAILLGCLGVAILLFILVSVGLLSLAALG